MTRVINAFNWREDPRPSIFLGGSDFTAYSTGKTRAQTTTAAVERITKATGRSPGTLTGISRSADETTLQFVARNRSAFGSK
jgi:hypothetical protein